MARETVIPRLRENEESSLGTGEKAMEIAMQSKRMFCEEVGERERVGKKLFDKKNIQST